MLHSKDLHTTNHHPTLNQRGTYRLIILAKQAMIGHLRQRRGCIPKRKW